MRNFGIYARLYFLLKFLCAYAYKRAGHEIGAPEMLHIDVSPGEAGNVSGLGQVFVVPWPEPREPLK